MTIFYHGSISTAFGDEDAQITNLIVMSANTGASMTNFLMASHTKGSPMRKQILAVALALPLALGACAGGGGTGIGVDLAPSTTSALKNVVIQYAVLKFIKGDQVRASRVRDVTDLAMGLVKGDVSVTLDVLEARVRDEIDFSKLKPEDALLVNTLISVVRAELQAKLGDAGVGDGAKVRIISVLTSVRDAAALMT